MRYQDDRPQPVDRRWSQEDVVQGVGINHQVPNLDGLVGISFAEGGIQLNVASTTDPLA